MQHSCEFVQTELSFTLLGGWLLAVLALLGFGREVPGELAGRWAGLRLTRCPGCPGRATVKTNAVRTRPLVRPREWRPTAQLADRPRPLSPASGLQLPTRHPWGVVSGLVPRRTLWPSHGDPPATAWAHLPCHASLSCVFLHLGGLWPPCVQRSHWPLFQQLLLMSRLCRIFTVLVAARLHHHSCVCGCDL